jgi:hypothetical protein
MAKKKLTKEQESEIKMLLANNEMLEKTKKEAEKRGNKTSVAQIERAQQEVIDHINMIDPSVVKNEPRKTSLASKKKEIKQDNLFGDTDMSIFDILKENEEDNSQAIETDAKVNEEDLAWSADDLTPSETTIATETTFNDIDPSVQYDVIQLPSNGQCYRNKMDRLPVAYLTAYDENIIMSPNLYKDGLVIDFLLKNKIVNKEINVDDLISGDVDAIILFLRATSYGPDFPIIVSDPETGEQIETTVDLTTLKPKEFTLIGDENGWFEYVTPIKKDVIKFRYMTRKQEKQLRKVTELENYGTKAFMLDTEKETLLAALVGDNAISDNEKKVIKSAVTVMENWSKKLKKLNESQFTRMMTNAMQLQITAVNGNTDREFIRKYINQMPARDSLMLRKYINDNRPGIDFNIEVQRPESLGGGSFKTFLNWDDSVFLNISDGREES